MKSQHWYSFLFTFILVLAMAQTRCQTMGTGGIQERQTGGSEIIELDQKVSQLLKAGKYKEALPLSLQELKLTEKIPSPDRHYETNALYHLGRIYSGMKEYRKAEPLLLKALAIREKGNGPDSSELVDVLFHLGKLYKNAGDYQKAEVYFSRSLRIVESLAPNSPQVFASSFNLGEVARRQGNYSKAENCFRRALELSEGMGDESLVASMLSRLGTVYFQTSQYRKAEPVIKRALSIRENLQDNFWIIGSLNELGRLYVVLGEYDKAWPLYKRALSLAEKELGRDDEDMAYTLHDIGKMYVHMGQPSKAIPLHKRALEIDERVLGSSHPDLVESLNNLANAYSSADEGRQAYILYQKALNLAETIYGPKHRAVAAILSNMARIQDDPKEAESLGQRALTIQEEVFGSSHPDVADSLCNLGRIYHEAGHYERAMSVYERAAGIRRKAFGQNHPQVAQVLYSMSRLEAAQGHHGSAIRLLRRAIDIQDKSTAKIFVFATEEQKLQYMTSVHNLYHTFLSIVQSQRNMAREGLEVVVNYKGLIYDAQARFQEYLHHRLSKEARTDMERLNVLRQDTARLALDKPDNMTTDMYGSKRAELEQRSEEIEQRLAGQAATMDSHLTRDKVSLDHISSNLPSNSAVIEIVKVYLDDFKGRRSFRYSRYLAFALTRKGQVELVDLGDGDTIEAGVEALLKQIRGTLANDPRRNEESVTSLKTMYKQLWRPFEKVLGDVDKVVIGPDGALNLLPFAALVDDSNRSLIERYRLAYVSSGRELAREKGRPKAPESDLLLVANPAFDRVMTGGGKHADAVRSRSFNQTFTSLPGTEQEAQEIPLLVPGDKKRKRVLVGLEATAMAVKAARNPRILHLATHGFFLGDQAAQLSSSVRGISVKSSSEEESEKRVYENPLLRSGLAFAGANHAVQKDEGDDGLLTAYEISGMDLSGTELVVLSACETAVGQVHSGEGVFGLRRAFALAGAKVLMMSLWPIDDEITARQMKAFYQNLSKLPPAEALRQAQLDTIKELRAKHPSASPALWAPFIVQGAKAIQN